MFETKYPLIKYVTGKSNDNACFSSTFFLSCFQNNSKALEWYCWSTKKSPKTLDHKVFCFPGTHWEHLQEFHLVSIISFWLLNFCAILNVTKIMVPSVFHRKYCLYEKATGTAAPLYWIRNPVSTKVTKFLWMPIWRIANTFLLKRVKIRLCYLLFRIIFKSPSMQTLRTNKIVGDGIPISQFQTSTATFFNV